jgi:hypothetical protein
MSAPNDPVLDEKIKKMDILEIQRLWHTLVVC